MSYKKLHALLEKPFVLADGAMGTMLQKSGLKLGERPDLLAITHPELIESIHRAYVGAGSDIIYTNTFGATEGKLAGSGYTSEEVVAAAVACAKRAAGTQALVALDMGPTGDVVTLGGPDAFEKAYRMYAAMVRAGEKAGADLAVIETMADLAEVRAALLAVRENSTLPAIVTMTFEKSGRTFLGCSLASMAHTLTNMGADIIGINCSLAPQEIFPLAQELCALTPLPVLIKANAGLPESDGSYVLDAETFAQGMLPYADIGVQCMGGCCGTSPDTIRALKKVLSGRTRPARTVKPISAVCSAAHTVSLGGDVRIVGERLNPTGKKRFRQALETGDMDYILSQALAQCDAGAEILDVNVGIPGIDEAAVMRRVVTELQSVVQTPLMLDSSRPEALEAGLRAYHGVAIINSVHAEEESLNTILPLARKYGAYVVGLTVGESGVPSTCEERVALALRIRDAARSYGIDDARLLIDCLTLTVSAQQEQAAETLEALRTMRDQYGLHTVLGVSNISFGLPERGVLNRTFLALALQNGLSAAIINPNAQDMTDTIFAWRVLSANDVHAGAYIDRMASRTATEKPAADTGSIHTLQSAVLRGLGAEAARLTRTLLQEKDAMAIIEEELIPALEQAGASFEAGRTFLPQLIQSAAAAQEAFGVIHTAMAQTDAPVLERGRIVLATVKGDVHDIGKNIVKTLLENYGYRIIDLGRDVSAETIVKTVCEQDVPLVGLSALMTTTVESMREAITALRNCGHPCFIMAGGAVLTEEYAKDIGADAYARDAQSAVSIARRVFGDK